MSFQTQCDGWRSGSGDPRGAGQEVLPKRGQQAAGKVHRGGVFAPGMQQSLFSHGLMAVRYKRAIMASSSVRGGLDWILGKISVLEESSGIGTNCPGKWWSHHPWRCSKNV